MAADMPDGWQQWCLYDVADYINGRATKPTELQPTGVPVIKIAELGSGISPGTDRVQKEAVQDRHWVHPGDLLFAWSGSVGIHVYRGPPAALNQHIFRVVARDGIDQRFLRFLLEGQMQTFVGFVENKKTTMGHVTVRDLRATHVAVPPPDEQRAIANILGTLDDKIELNGRISQTLEAMARALFKSWFVDFDPVRAKAEGRDPGLPQSLADLFPARFVDSELGEIPEGWEVGVLENALAELEVGGRPKGGVAAYSHGVPSIGAESIVRLGVFDYSKTKFVPREYFDKMTKGHIKSRDVLLYKDGGRPGEFEPHVTLFGDGFPFEIAAINEHVYRLRARPHVGQEFLFFWLSSELVMAEMRIKGTGVAVPGLNSTQVKSLTTLFPSSEVIDAFSRHVEPCIARVLAACNESRTLAALRDSLLPKLISGDLRVGDAHRFVERALA